MALGGVQIDQKQVGLESELDNFDAPHDWEAGSHDNRFVHSNTVISIELLAQVRTDVTVVGWTANSQMLTDGRPRSLGLLLTIARLQFAVPSTYASVRLSAP